MKELTGHAWAVLVLVVGVLIGTMLTLLVVLLLRMDDMAEALRETAEALRQTGEQSPGRYQYAGGDDNVLDTHTGTVYENPYLRMNWVEGWREVKRGGRWTREEL